MKSDYRVRATRFLHSIFPYIENDLTDISEIEECVKNYNRDHNRKVEVMNGSARIVLLTSDYVIKWDYDEENAKGIGGCWDEYNAYMRAKQEGFDYLLAETTLIIINNILFSIMPRIKDIGYSYHHGGIQEYLTCEEFKWLNTFDKDIHHYNWGIRNGKACIIDYAFTQEVLDRCCEEE